MTIGTDKDLKALERIGQIVAITREEMLKNVRTGITTKELDLIGESVLSSFGALSAPKSVYNFPGITCISVNDEAAHGIPGSRVLKQGDIINVDVSAELEGYFADTGATIVLGDLETEMNRLCICSKNALYKAMKAARAGVSLNRIGKAIYNEAISNGYKVIKNLSGHGIGKSIHEFPKIVNYYDVRDKLILKSGLVLAIETFISTNAEFTIQDRNGWTLKTFDGSRVAQFEHTIIVTDNEPIVLTK